MFSLLYCLGPERRSRRRSGCQIHENLVRCQDGEHWIQFRQVHFAVILLLHVAEQSSLWEIPLGRIVLLDPHLVFQVHPLTVFPNLQKRTIVSIIQQNVSFFQILRRSIVPNVFSGLAIKCPIRNAAFKNFFILSKKINNCRMALFHTYKCCTKF